MMILYFYNAGFYIYNHCLPIGICVVVIIIKTILLTLYMCILILFFVNVGCFTLQYSLL